MLILNTQTTSAAVQNILHCESKKLCHFFTAYNFRNIEQIFTKFGINQSLFILNIVPVYLYLLLLLVWHAPLGVRSAKRRHQSPEWTILSHSYRLIQ